MCQRISKNKTNILPSSKAEKYFDTEINFIPWFCLFDCKNVFLIILHSYCHDCLCYITTIFKSLFISTILYFTAPRLPFFCNGTRPRIKQKDPELSVISRHCSKASKVKQSWANFAPVASI